VQKEESEFRVDFKELRVGTNGEDFVICTSAYIYLVDEFFCVFLGLLNEELIPWHHDRDLPPPCRL